MQPATRAPHLALPPASDPAAFRRVYEEQTRYVWSSLRRLGVPPGELADLTHEVFTVAFRKWSSYDGQRPLRPWLFGIAFRIVLDFKRKGQNRNEAAVLTQELMEARSATEDHGRTAEVKDLAVRALAKLELDRRALLVMHDLDGHTMPEIAAELEVPLNTAYSRLRLARNEFNAAVKELLEVRE